MKMDELIENERLMLIKSFLYKNIGKRIIRVRPESNLATEMFYFLTYNGLEAEDFYIREVSKPEPKNIRKTGTYEYATIYIGGLSVDVKKERRSLYINYILSRSPITIISKEEELRLIEKGIFEE